jgi:hypothetical protein
MGERRSKRAKHVATRLPRKAADRVTRKRAWPRARRVRLRHRAPRTRVRIRFAHYDDRLTESRSEEWLLIEWPAGEDEPAKYWFSTLPKGITFPRLGSRSAEAALANRARLSGAQTRSRAGHFEGQGWRGIHHHATLCIVAYGFLVSERERIPPRDLVPPGCPRNLPFPPVTDPEAPPIRPKRHIPNSIATMRRRLIIALTRRLSRCPWCSRPAQTHETPNLLTQ